MIALVFSNKSVNALNVHYGLQTFANNTVNIFIGIYLYKLGIPLWVICLTWGSIYILRLFLRPFGFFLCHKFGLRKTLIAGTLSYSFLYLIIGQIKGVDMWLFLYVFSGALSEGVYWLAYHTYFAVLGDNKIRGKQIGVREAVRNLALFLAPMVGALLISGYNFWLMFTVAMICMILASIPLFSAPEVYLPEYMPFRETLKQIPKKGFYLYCSDSFYYQSTNFVWKLVLFIFLSNYITFGGLLSLAVIFQIAGYFLVGHLFDNGRTKNIFILGLLLTAVAVIGRTFFMFSIPIIIILDVIFMAGYCLYEPVMNSLFYNYSKKSPHPLWFQAYADTGWDIGSGLAMVFAAIWLYFGMDIQLIMLQGLLGLFGIFVVLRKMNKMHP
jgi:MFS family permease